MNDLVSQFSLFIQLQQYLTTNPVIFHDTPSISSIKYKSPVWYTMKSLPFSSDIPKLPSHSFCFLSLIQFITFCRIFRPLDFRLPLCLFLSKSLRYLAFSLPPFAKALNLVTFCRVIAAEDPRWRPGGIPAPSNRQSWDNNKIEKRE